MKKSIVLAIVGVLFAMCLSSCAQGAPADIVGKWKVKSGTPYVSTTQWYFDIKDDGSVMYGHDDPNAYYSELYKIKTNSCNVLEMTDGTKFKYEISGNTMTWKYHSDDGISGAIAGAIAGDYATFEK